MLRALAQREEEGGKRLVLYLGLDVKNVSLLLDGKPLLIPAGYNVPEIVVFYGATQADCVDLLTEAGVELPDTIEGHEIDKDQERG